MDIRELFGTNLRFYRKKAGLSQEFLAEKLDISTQHVSNIETGRKFVSASLLQDITDILHVSPSVLFYNPSENITDDEQLNEIDGIVQSELEQTVMNIKTRIRCRRNEDGAQK